MTAEKGPKLFINHDRYPGDFGHDDDLMSADYKDEDDEDLYEFDWNISGKAYAWGRTAYRIYEPHLKQAYFDTEGPFTAVDLCSAFPLNAQILRDHYREDRFYSARDIVTGLINKLQSGSLEFTLPPSPDINEESKQKLISSLTAKNSRIRSFLTIGALDLLYNPPAVDGNEGTTRNIFLQANYLLGRFHHSSNILGQFIRPARYERALPPDVFLRLQKGTLDKLIKSSTGIENPFPVLASFAIYIAEKCAQKYRKFSVLSLDNEDSATLRKDADEGFPELFRTQFIYDRAHNYMKSHHLRADVFTLPFPPDSLSLITSIEGYPFYFTGLPLEEKEDVTENQSPKPNHLSFAQSVIDVLRPGGRAVFFPWHVKNQTSEDIQNLEEVEEYWRNSGMEVIKKRHHRLQLKIRMGDRELDLSNHSPLFTENPLRVYFTALTVVKPKDFRASQEEG